MIIEKQLESPGYLFGIEQKHRNHPAMGPKGGGRTRVVSGDKPVKVPRLQPDATGKVPVPKKVAEAGAKLAMESLRADRNWEGAMSQRQDIQWGKKKREWEKRQHELIANENNTRKLMQDKLNESRKFEDEHGVSTVQAWEAQEGKHWPYYKVDTGSHEATHYVKD